ncbi:MAG: PrsW family intramembrane metalloprotease [Treponema sp.]|nr:PrsW family intramembrane metalloprotease [Treponema sp.]
MNVVWVLLLLIVAAALPAIIAFLWFRAKKIPVTLPWFLASLAAGLISLLIAALIQGFLPAFGGDGLGTIFFTIFVRIALLEELSRLFALVPLLLIIRRRRSIDAPFVAAVGLAAGLGFAMLESAFYGMADFRITLLRAFTAAPLHGACGIRVGAALAFFIGKNRVKAVFLLISAVFIHGAYNLAIVSPALISVLAILIAIAALFSSLQYIKAEEDDDENSFNTTYTQP